MLQVRPTGYPDGLALCVIDSIQSVGVRCSVENVVQRYRGFQGNDAATDGMPELSRTFASLGVDGWVQRIGTRN